MSSSEPLDSLGDGDRYLCSFVHLNKYLSLETSVVILTLFSSAASKDEAPYLSNQQAHARGNKDRDTRFLPPSSFISFRMKHV